MDQIQGKTGIQPVADLFRLLRHVLQQESGAAVPVKAEVFDMLLKLSKQHEVQSLATYGLLLSGGLTSQQEEQCRKLLYRTLLFQKRMDREFARTCNLLEGAGLSYMPLKGAVIRDLYPEPWLRTSGDIDILVRDVDQAVAVLEENGYGNKRQGSHDITLTSPGGIPVELHFQLIERTPRVNAVLQQVWDCASVKVDSCCYRMDPELFYFYHIAHMAKHMALGGCGIRNFADIWILNQKLPMEEEKKKRLLREGGLAVFAEQAEQLSRVWFGDGQRDLLVQELERFVLNGGVFGSRGNVVTVLRAKSDVPGGFFLRRIFKPYDRMSAQYPVLKKYPLLLPIFWVRRWLNLFFKRGKIRNAVKELELNRNLDEQAVLSVRQLFQELELH